MKEEIWKPIKGYEEVYAVSNEGNVKSLEREVIDSLGRTQKVQETIIKQDIKYGPKRKEGIGYRIASLSDHGKLKHFQVHRLVAEAFIPNPNNYPQVNHIDGNKANNNASNLEWVSDQMNKQHAKDNGLLRAGSHISWESPNAKLTKDDVLRIRELYKSGMQVSDIAPMFGIAEVTARSAALGHSYKEVGNVPEMHKKERGANSPYASINAEQVAEIRALLAQHKTYKEIGEKYGVSQSTIWRIANNLRYN